MAKDYSSFAVIWDMDGTLVDTAELHFQAWSELARKYQFPFSKADFEATFGRRNPEIIHQLLGAELSPEQVHKLGEEKELLYRDQARHGVNLLPGAKNLLQGIADRGLAQAVGSSAPRANLELILEITNTREFFSAIVGMEDTNRGKPDPDVFLQAARRLDKSPNNCLVMEDAIAGIQAARAGNMRSIAVTFVGHHPQEKLTEAGADLVVGSLEELTAQTILGLFGQAG